MITPMGEQAVSFESGGVRCNGWVRRPEGPPAPVVVLAHGYSATHALHYWRVAERLEQAGFAVLDFDPRHLGASDGQPRQLISVAELKADLRAAVSFARTLEEVDGSRLALWGSSLGGGLAADLAAEDQSISALVMVVPHLDGRTSMPGTPAKARLRLVRAAIAARLARLQGRESARLRVFGNVGDDGAMLTRDEGASLLEEELREDTGSHYVNETSPWDALQMAFYRPGLKLSRVSCPMLAVIGRNDTISPPGPQRRLAQAAGAEIAEVDQNHFGVFRPSKGFEEVTALHADFLRRHLLAPAGASAG